MATHYHVYANAGAGGPVDYSTPVATVSGPTWSAPALAPGSSWSFGVRAFDTVSGLEESNVDAAVSLALDGSGADLSGRPLAPNLLAARAGPGGSVALRWSYPRATRSARKPTGFRVYLGTPTASFGSPAATVAYLDSGSFSATVAGLTAGSSYQAVCRAYNAAGEETNTDAVTFSPATAGPASAVALAGSLTSAAGLGR